jgi:uncharacterized membrane protein
VAPLLVMLASWLVAGVVSGFISHDWLHPWTNGLRIALAVMFLFTAVSHFHPRTRADLMRMVPPRLPRADRWVTLTGILECAGAIGLLVPRLAAAAGYGLALLLVAMFPANVHAARANLTIAGRRATSFWPRLALQVFWIAALWWVAEDARGR